MKNITIATVKINKYSLLILTYVLLLKGKLHFLRNDITVRLKKTYLKTCNVTKNQFL